ncbi:hypothetical protein BN182_1800001 [Clostridioides difficile E9]|nr:hypothetical protein BN182_1800001 [Clostridioides difficile E9]CCL76240.1 hypothetical protein BN186_1390001 [Clostridioides difficile E23]CCL87663.1 hypothetical protein BN189_2370002 [Clostridioides difficile T10]
MLDMDESDNVYKK